MLRFNLEQIAAFVAVAENSSFSDAARASGKSRSTLHHQVTNLEVDLNLALFNRAGKGVVLTQEGRVLLEQAKHLLYHAKYLQNSADSLSDGASQQLTVYHDAVLPPHLIARADRWVSDAFPLVDIQWLRRDRKAMYQGLINGDVDLGLALSSGGTLPMHGVDFYNLGVMPIDIYTSKHSPLVAQQPCSLHDLTQHRYLMLEDYLDTPVFFRSQIKSHPKQVSNVDMLMAMLEDSGWAVLPVALVNNHPNRDRLVSLKLNFISNTNVAEYIMFSNKLHTAEPALSSLIESIKVLFTDELALNSVSNH
ncbi:LysR family transcriptional regulator [Vibrio sp. WXL103]|uniref:LysR family transcriptional regulator n=1 Tax=Vibrio sp. WXL103 TaxID=3450710 RepID=UPI003EC92CC8